MINEIQIELNELCQIVGEFYDYKKHHLSCVNATDLGNEKVKLQWIFAHYEIINEYTIFVAFTNYDTNVPTITKIVPSAVMSEMEIVDLFGLKIDETPKGLYLDEKSPMNPLRCQI